MNEIEYLRVHLGVSKSPNRATVGVATIIIESENHINLEEVKSKLHDILAEWANSWHHIPGTRRTIIERIEVG